MPQQRSLRTANIFDFWTIMDSSEREHNERYLNIKMHRSHQLVVIQITRVRVAENQKEKIRIDIYHYYLWTKNGNLWTTQEKQGWIKRRPKNSVVRRGGWAEGSDDALPCPPSAGGAQYSQELVLGCSVMSEGWVGWGGSGEGIYAHIRLGSCCCMAKLTHCK